jgi:cytochrome b561
MPAEFLRRDLAMTLLGTKVHYGPIAQAFHWVMAALVIAALLSAVAADRGAWFLVLHEGLGVAIFVMATLRLTWRAFDRLPGKPPMSAVLARWSWRVDVALYVLLFAVPITGMIGAHEMQAVLASGLAQHPPGPSVIGLHRLLGILLFLAAGLHSALALVHHYVKKDGVLAMMLPERRAA